MRIAIFTNTYRPTVSGVVQSIALFRQGLMGAGHEVFIFTPEYEDYEDEEPYIFRFPALDLPDELDLSLAIPLKTPISPTIRGIKAALIHSQHPFVMGSLAAAFAHDLNLPLVFTFHTRYDEYAQRYVPIAPQLAEVVTEKLVERYLQKCTHIIAPTPSTREFILREYAPDAPVTVVPTPVDLDEYHNLAPERIRSAIGLEKAEILLYTGRLAKEKGLDFLLRAFAQIAPKHAPAMLLLVGKGPYQQDLANMARKLGLERRIIFAGAIPHHQIPHYAAAADLFVFSSTTETQGVVLIEAMAAGTPVVAVKAPGPGDILAEGGGLLVPPQEETFAEAVLGLLEDRPRRLALGEQAAQVARRYSLPATTERLLSVYRDALASGPRTTE